MKNKITMVLIIFFAIILFPGGIKKSTQVEQFFKQMKTKDVKACVYTSIGPGFGVNINNRLAQGDVTKLVKLLNKSKKVAVGRFPISKGGFSGLTLTMKNGTEYTFYSVTGGFWTFYGKMQYKILLPEYNKFFTEQAHKQANRTDVLKRTIRYYSGFINTQMKVYKKSYDALYSFIQSAKVDAVYRQKLIGLMDNDKRFSYVKTKQQVDLYKNTVSKTHNLSTSVVNYYKKCLFYVFSQRAELNKFIQLYPLLLEKNRLHLKGSQVMEGNRL